MNEPLDEIDIQLLLLLKKNSRLTEKALGEKLNLSSAAVARRIKHMEDSGIIKAYTVTLDPGKIDRGQIALTHVQLKDHSQMYLTEFEQAIVRLPEVIECYHMSGAYDFILKVAVKDLDRYYDFLMDELYEIENIGAVQSTFVLKEAKHETPDP